MSKSIEKIDTVTAVIKKSIDFLFIYNPKGTALGILLGAVIFILLHVFFPLLDGIKWLNIKYLDAYGCIIVGIFLMNSPYIFKEKVVLPDDFEQALKAVKIADKNRALSKEQKALRYRMICDMAIRKININTNPNGPDGNNPIKPDRTIAD